MDAFKIVNQGIQTIIGGEALKERLEAGKKLRVKLGVDPNRPDLTFGHMVVLNKLRQFQDLGHIAILLIGDYTATIGDPSGRSATRPSLTPEAVLKNAETYLDQAFKVLDPQKTEIRYNSEWFKKMSFEDALALSRKMTVARMLERDDFSKRFKENSAISIVEFLYPLLQGYDSVMLEADVELGGNDQLFNMLVGRQLQKNENMPEQSVICMPLLIGLDGIQKMSKSYNNYIGFNDSPSDMFGKIMSINDEVMLAYYDLLLLKEIQEIEVIKQLHPLEAKKQLACELVGKLHSAEEGLKARQHFDQVFSRREIPEVIECFQVSTFFQDSVVSLVDLLNATKKFSSKKEIKRLIEQGSVKVNTIRREEPSWTIDTKGLEQEWIVQAGKRIFFKFIP